MSRLAVALVLAWGTLCTACTDQPAPMTPATPVLAPDRHVRVTILQLNDVYEITPLENGKVGGLARVAGLLAELKAKNANTVAILSGDFVSPSALGTARVDGARLDGRQMVAVLNKLPMDWVTFGNHELDLKESALRDRIAESKFHWISGNVREAASGQPFPGVDRTVVQTFTNGRGDAFRLAWVAATIQENQPPYVILDDPMATLSRDVAALDGRTDAIVALTHVDKETDFQFAAQIPPLDLILGGHEHENWRVFRGADLTPVTKADANARTVYVHELDWDAAAGRLTVASHLVPITADTPEVESVAVEVTHWVDLAYAGFRASGFEPTEVVTTTDVALDGREASVRNQETPLSRLIAEAMLEVVDDAEVAIFNTGSIRIDDVLAPGAITQYDVIRVLPFGGDVVSVAMRGSTLQRTLEQGLANRGTGGFLEAVPTAKTEAGWTIGGAALDPTRSYRVAITDYLLTGNEHGLPFLSPAANPEIHEVARHGDIRQAVISQLRSQAP